MAPLHQILVELAIAWPLVAAIGGGCYIGRRREVQS